MNIYRKEHAKREENRKERIEQLKQNKKEKKSKILDKREEVDEGHDKEIN